MGHRAFTVYELAFRQKRKRNPSLFVPADLGGEDLLKIFETWARSLMTAETHNEDRQTWVSVGDVSLYALRVLLLDLHIGAYDEAGELADVDTDEPAGTIVDNQTPTGSSRALLFVPETGERVYFLSRGSSCGQTDGRIRDLFRPYFSSYIDEVTMVMTTVTKSEAWAEAAELTGVEVRVENKSVDVASGPHIEVGKVSHIVRPRRRKRFPRKPLNGLKDGDTLRRIVSVEDLPEDHRM